MSSLTLKRSCIYFTLHLITAILSYYYIPPFEGNPSTNVAPGLEPLFVTGHCRGLINLATGYVMNSNFCNRYI